MPIQDISISVLAIFLGSVGHLMIKTGLNVFTSRFGAISVSSIWKQFPGIIITPQIIAAVICFLISGIFWSVVMSKRDLSQVYPMIALAHLFIALMAYFILKEHIGIWRIAGIAVIVLGAIILNQDKVANTGIG
ncbi:MAG: EamA family transporter [bacterium]